MADEELIKKFVDLHSQTEHLLDEEKLAEAKQKYLETVDAYHTIEKSALENFHKELAYDQVTLLFKKVNDTRERIKVPYHLIAAAVLIIAFSIVIFLHPSIVGLAGLDDVIRQPVDYTFTQTKVQQVTLKERPLSLSASGEYTGVVKLYYKQGEKLELIFDSNKAKDNTFTDACVESCDIIAQSNSIELFAQIEPGAKLVIKELSYKVQHKSNTAPIWKGDTRAFKATVGKASVIDLDQYFSDAENDDLVYLSTTEEGLDVRVQNSKVTITPKVAGSKNLIFIASDLREVTRVPVTIESK